MDRIVTRRRSPTTDDPEAGLPPRFEAVGEALASGSGSVSACEVLGSVLARDGVTLAEALDDLSTTWRAVRGDEPSHADLRALSVAWSDATLGYVHALSCADPLTGLASPAHLRTCVADVRRAGSADVTHALVIVVAETVQDDDRAGEALVRAMEDAQLGALVRGVFPGRETIARLGPGRLVVLADRDDVLGRRVDLLLRMLGSDVVPHPRVWVEGVPDTDAAAGSLLDALTRD